MFVLQIFLEGLATKVTTQGIDCPTMVPMGDLNTYAGTEAESKVTTELGMTGIGTFTAEDQSKTV